MFQQWPTLQVEPSYTVYGSIRGNILRHITPKRDPITTRSKEYLDQVINSNIEPRVKATILPIADLAGGNILIVQVEPGETAHQASDNKYYRRYNFEVRAMRDYEIRDVMNRAHHPSVRATFSFTSDQMIVELVNDGQILATKHEVLLQIPKHWMIRFQMRQKNFCVQRIGDIIPIMH